MSDAGYDRQVQAQIEQYADAEYEMHDLSPITRYLDAKRGPKGAAFTGASSIAELFATTFIAALGRSESHRIGSLGAGDCGVEIKIARAMRELGAPRFELICYELSPILAERGHRQIADDGLADCVTVVACDLNKPTEIGGLFAAFMAHHSLHHILGLEALFDAALAHLDRSGAFAIADIIGRNGHARWPEVRTLVREIWARLPERYRFDHSYKVVDRWFENRDCSLEGFEGIRAQNILPLLIERFHFEMFYAAGGLVDVFVERGFGPNFSPHRDDDTTFIDSLQAAEDALLDAGRMTPTGMLAVLRKDRGGETRCFAGRQPLSCVRRTDGPDPAPITLAETAIRIPFEPPAPPPLTTLPTRSALLSFGAGGHGDDLLRWGWASEPDPDFRWAVDEASALAFAFGAGEALQLTLGLLAYIPTFGTAQRLRIEVNGAALCEAVFDDRDDVYRQVVVDVPAQANGTYFVEIVPSVTRRPDIEGGADKRPLTFALTSLAVRAA